MHIEKINDNQIKCILSEHDLLDRELDLSELAYGTEKARSLFREMIEQAHDAFGFEAENTPLMVEAIPVSRESIVLIITRIDSPDELDTRFSRFSPMDTDVMLEEEDDSPERADDILDWFRSSSKKRPEETSESNEENCERALDLSSGQNEEDSLHVSDSSSGQNEEDSLHVSDSSSRQPKASQENSFTDEKSAGDIQTGQPISEFQKEPPANLMRIYCFHNLDHLIELAGILHPIYNGINSLYKDEEDSIYYLVVYQSHHSPSDFNKTCNILSEYGQRIKGTSTREAYYAEHYTCIVSQTALQRLYLF